MSVAPEKTVTDVVTDFLSSGPSLAEIAAYRLPEALQRRAHNLLDENQVRPLSDEEQNEMEEFRRIDQLLTLVKAKARLRLKAQHE